MVRFSWVWRALLRMGHPQVRWLVWLMTQDGLMPSQFQGAGALPLNRMECGFYYGGAVSRSGTDHDQYQALYPHELLRASARRRPDDASTCLASSPSVADPHRAA